MATLSSGSRGETAVINASLAGVVRQAKRHPQIGGIFGMRFGIGIPKTVAGRWPICREPALYLSSLCPRAGHAPQHPPGRDPPGRSGLRVRPGNSTISSSSRRRSRNRIHPRILDAREGVQEPFHQARDVARAGGDEVDPLAGKVHRLADVDLVASILVIGVARVHRCVLETQQFQACKPGHVRDGPQQAHAPFGPVGARPLASIVWKNWRRVDI